MHIVTVRHEGAPKPHTTFRLYDKGVADKMAIRARKLAKSAGWNVKVEQTETEEE